MPQEFQPDDNGAIPSKQSGERRAKPKSPEPESGAVLPWVGWSRWSDWTLPQNLELEDSLAGKNLFFSVHYIDVISPLGNRQSSHIRIRNAFFLLTKS